jgi:HSP20 family molecular chaperone IbpA
MRELKQPAGACNLRRLRILTASEPLLTKAIDDSIAYRTNQIQRANGRDPNTQLNDFLAARAEIYRRMNGGILSSIDQIDVVTDASCFDREEEIKIYVEPRRVTLSGRASARKRGAGAEQKGVELAGNMIFRFLDLGEEIIPPETQARFNGCVLELYLPKMHAGLRAA